MTEEAVTLDDLESRTRAWAHARDVLTVPQFVSISGLVQSAAVLDEMIMDLEAKYETNERGAIIAHNWQQVMALADFWILGFFELLRIITSKDYMRIAQFKVGKELEDLKTEANMVRSAFAKLQMPGKRTYILPSHSRVFGDRGITYTVYDNHGQEIDVNRRELCDRFLRLMMKWPPSRSMKELLKSLVNRAPAESRGQG
jgi:hypothetical protein